MPKITFDAPESYTVESRGAAVTVETSKLHANALARLFEYGVTQALADSASAAAAKAKEDGKDVDAVTQEMLEKKLATLYDGTMRIAVSRVGDPVQREFLAIVMPKVAAKYKAKGFKLSGKGDDVVKQSTIREKALEFGGDRNNPPSEQAKKAWDLARKRVEEAAFSI